VLSELLGLLWIQAQKQRHYDGPQANATLDAAVIDTIAQPDTCNDLRVGLDVLEGRDWSDIQVRVPLTREYAPVAFYEHQTPRRSRECILRRVPMNAQHVSCIAGPARCP
jgi:hypothetical protein